MLGSEIRFPLQQQRENRFGSPFVVDADMPGACPRDLKAPLSGAGGVDNGSRPLARSAGPSPVFRSRGGQKETPKESKNHCISAIYNDFTYTPPPAR